MVTLMALGKREYYQWAANMATSIRYHSPSMPIQLIHDGQFDVENIDVLTLIDPEDCYHEGSFSPSKAKLNIYKYLEAKTSIYLDVDGIVLKPLEPLLSHKNYGTHVNGKAGKQEENPHMLWAEHDLIYSKYKVPDNALMPGINSSLQVIQKSRKTEKLFKDAYKYFLDPVPLKLKWGRTSTQPDELYMNIALAKSGIDYDLGKCVYLRTRQEPGKYERLEDITSRCYVLGCWGDTMSNHESVSHYYDKLVDRYSKQVNGYGIRYKFNRLIQTKFVLNK